MGRTRVALIVNERSGRGPEPERLAGALEAHGASARAFDVGAVDEVAPWRPDRVVVAGGDGSVAPAARAAARTGVALAVVPAGTANDFARVLGLPTTRQEEALRLAAAGTRTRRLDLALMGERPFVNVANAGLAVPAAQRAVPLKPVLGPLAYGVGALRAGLTADPVRCAVSCDGEEAFAGAAWMVVVANTGAFGGGSGLEEADPADGRLDVAVVPAGSRLSLARRAAGLRSGRLTGQPDVVHRVAQRVEVEQDGNAAAFNVDGELCEGNGRTTFAIERGAFEVVVG